MIAGYTRQGLQGIFPMSALVISGLLFVYAAVVTTRRNLLVAIFLGLLGAFMIGIGAVMFTFAEQAPSWFG